MEQINKDMKKLEEYFKKAKLNNIAFEGYCHDCKKLVRVNVDILKDGILQIKGGAVYFPEIIGEEDPPDFFVKCESCFQSDSVLRNYQPCDIYSRTVGFYRPIKYWNPGKQAEFESRKTYNLPESDRLKIEGTK